MSEVPVLVVNKLEIGEIKLCFYHFTQLILYFLSPMSYKDYKFINIPCNSATGHISIIAFKFCFQPLNVGTIIFFCPNLTMQLGVCYEWHTILLSLFQHFGSQFHLVYAKEFHFLDVEPEYANARNSAIGKFLHTIHYCVVFFLCSFSHNCVIIKIFLANV